MNKRAYLNYPFLLLLFTSFFWGINSLSSHPLFRKNLSLTHARCEPPSTLRAPSTPLFSSKNEDFCRADMDNSSSIGGAAETEVSRLKFMLQQARTSLQESESRKEAAEQRLVALENHFLKHQGEIVEEMTDEDVAMKRFNSAMQESKLKLAQLKANSDSWHMTNSKHASSTESSASELPPIEASVEQKDLNNLQKDKSGWQPKKVKLQLQQARENLTQARSEVRQLRTEMMELETRMEKNQLQASLDTRKTLAQFQQRYQQTEKNLMNERELLRHQLTSSQSQNEELRIHLERTKTESTKHIISVTSKARKQIDHAQKEVRIRSDALQFQNGVIAWLLNERKSVRKLCRVQYRIISKRVVLSLKRWVAVVKERYTYLVASLMP